MIFFYLYKGKKKAFRAYKILCKYDIVAQSGSLFLLLFFSPFEGKILTVSLLFFYVHYRQVYTLVYALI